MTIQEAGGGFTGAWQGPGGTSGQITEGRMQGSTLILEYVAGPGNTRGRAVFSWNPRSQVWEGNWRHRDGRSGGWNLRRSGGAPVAVPPAGGGISSQAGPVRMMEVLVDPATARAGDTIDLVLRYEITGAEAAITEVRRIVAPDGSQKGIWRDPKTLGPGIHRSSRKVRIAPSTKPGTYEVRGEIQAGASQAALPATFTIAGGVP